MQDFDLLKFRFNFSQLSLQLRPNGGLRAKPPKTRGPGERSAIYAIFLTKRTHFRWNFCFKACSDNRW